MKLILLLASLLSLEALGHGGGLDAKGGHYNRSTAEYHCHQEPCFSNQQNQIDETESDAPLLRILRGFRMARPATDSCRSALQLKRITFFVGLLIQQEWTAPIEVLLGSLTRLVPKSLIAQTVERADDFRSDTELPKECRKELFDFSGSYDRGHLASSETLDGNYTMNSETFLLGNMSPQLSGFNRAIWKGLENRERKWANE